MSFTQGLVMEENEDPGFDKCLKSGGNFCKFIRDYPQFHKHICHNYSSWSPRQKSIFELIGDKIRKMLDT